MPLIIYKNAKGQRVSGTTTIIGQNLGWNKQQLMWWANQMGLEGKNHRDVAKKEADAGTLAHTMIEADIKQREMPEGFPKDIVDKAKVCYLNFLEWKEQIHFNPIHTEVHLISEKYQYGATPDCIAEINGKLSLFDWKTSSGLYPDMLIQLAAYEQAWEENHMEYGIDEYNLTPEEGCCCTEPLEGGFYLLRIGKEDASWHYHHWDALPEAWECFKHLNELHKLQKVLKKKV